MQFAEQQVLNCCDIGSKIFEVQYTPAVCRNATSEQAGTAPRGVHSGAVPPNHYLCPPNENRAPPSEDCTTGSVPLKCSLRLETRKILVITPEFVCKNCFFAYFAIRTHFLWFYPKTSKNSPLFEMKNFFFLFLRSLPQNS